MSGIDCGRLQPAGAFKKIKCVAVKNQVYRLPFLCLGINHLGKGVVTDEIVGKVSSPHLDVPYDDNFLFHGCSTATILLYFNCVLLPCSIAASCLCIVAGDYVCI